MSQVTKRPAMPVKLQSQVARASAYAIRRMTDSLGSLHCVSNLLNEAFTICAAQERQHRAMGARLTPGKSSYRLSVTQTVNLFVGQWFFVRYPEFHASSRGLRYLTAAELTELRADHRNVAMSVGWMLSEDPGRIDSALSGLQAVRVESSGYWEGLSTLQILKDWAYAADVPSHYATL